MAGSNKRGKSLEERLLAARDSSDASRRRAPAKRAAERPEDAVPPRLSVPAPVDPLELVTVIADKARADAGARRSASASEGDTLLPVDSVLPLDSGLALDAWLPAGPSEPAEVDEAEVSEADDAPDPDAPSSALAPDAEPDQTAPAPIAPPALAKTLFGNWGLAAAGTDGACPPATGTEIAPGLADEIAEFVHEIEEITGPDDVVIGVVPPATEPLDDNDDAPWTRRTVRTGRFGRIGTTMVERGLISGAQLDEALDLQRSTGRRVGDILVGMGALSRFELARVLADHSGVPFVDLRAKPPDPILASMLPEEVARRYNALPIARWNDQLVIAMATPTDLFALDDLQMVMHQPIIAAMVVDEDLQAAIDNVYRVSDVESTLDAANSDYAPSHEVSAAQNVVEVEDGPVVRLVNALMEQAIRDHASDLHIEPSSSHIAVRMRIDGVLHDASTVPLRLLRPLVSRLKILANLDIAQNRTVQDGRFSVTIHGRGVDVRVVTVPTAAGESVILRLLDPTRDTLDVSSLGLSEAERARFLPPFFASQGAAFITGPTGSGKTSSVYAVLSEINTRSKSIVSVEDPVEYKLDGIKQIQVNSRVGVTFAHTLPSILRADPDIIFIGEVRDTETARIAADASITGHLVLSTLHATGTAAAPMRLIEMGVEPYLVASALTLVVAQRLARKLCQLCAQPVDAADLRVVRGFGADEEILDGATVRRAVGCPACHHTGYRGRLPIFEIMPVTEGISRLILDRAPRAQIESLAVAEGMDTIRVAALRRVASGELTLDEMVRVIS